MYRSVWTNILTQQDIWTNYLEMWKLCKKRIVQPLNSGNESERWGTIKLNHC